jgi:poly-gamma-glutamate capsule biosynthesis protein CapA/YwtB (metallophosphatase superfamily)
VALSTLAFASLTGPSSALAKKPPRHRKPQASFTLNWVGDIAFSSDRGLPAGGPGEAFAPVDGPLRAADLVMGNLEGTLSVGGTSKCGGAGSGGNCFAFQAPPSYAGGFRRAGFTLLNQANNHALDFGPGGQQQTLAALDAAGIAHDGLPGEITLLRIHAVRVAVLGFAPYDYASNLLDIPGAQSLVRRARRHADVVVVVIHAGAEGADQLHTPHSEEFAFGEDRGHARAFAHAVINAGAAIVLGSGPHVIRGIERFRNRMIAYSLGDFAGPNTLAIGGVLSDSAILHVRLAADGHVLGGRWTSLALVAPGLPRVDPSHASLGLVRALSIEDFDSHRYGMLGDGFIRP